jgi:hypothetical protein
MKPTPQAFPGLIELPSSLLRQESQAGNFRGALLVLRDCWEAAIKLLGIMLYADLTATVEDGNDQDLINLVIPLLSKPPALGDWLDFYLATSRFAYHAGLKDRLIIPELCGIVHSPGRNAKSSIRLTPFGKSLWSVVAWRNDTIGHGAASHDVMQVQQMVQEQTERLEIFLGQVGFLRAVRLFSSAPGGAVIEWNTHEHPAATGLDASSTPYFPVWMQRGTNTRSLSPLLMMGTSKQHHCLLTFDKLTKGVFFLDYFLGTKVRFPHVPEIARIQAHHLSLERLQSLQDLKQGGVLLSASRSYSGAVVKAMGRIEFGSDMEKWFVKQTYLIAALEPVFTRID